MKNLHSLDSLCAALSFAVGIEAPDYAAKANPNLCEYISNQLGSQKADRVFMYNPDAIAQLSK